jgi:GNAT superfamily N-acetyltransferase
VSVRRLRPEDHLLLRTLRLRCLREEPTAFGSTYEREVSFDDDVWTHRLRPGGNPHWVFEAPHGSPAGSPAGSPMGIVAGARDEAEPHVADVLGMWVDPAARGSGVADALIAQVIAWAEDERLTMLRLHATEGNVRAEGAYRRHGFARTGRTFLRERDGLTEFEMARAVGAAV